MSMWIGLSTSVHLRGQQPIWRSGLSLQHNCFRKKSIQLQKPDPVFSYFQCLRGWLSDPFYQSASATCAFLWVHWSPERINKMTFVLHVYGRTTSRYTQSPLEAPRLRTRSWDHKVMFSMFARRFNRKRALVFAPFITFCLDFGCPETYLCDSRRTLRKAYRHSTAETKYEPPILQHLYVQ